MTLSARCFRTIACVTVLLLPATAQLSLTTTYIGGNGNFGNMFDITALNPIIIDSIDTAFGPGAFTVEVYTVTAGTSYQPVQGTPAAWTLVGSAVTTSAALAAATPVPLNLNISVASGQTLGMYVCTTVASQQYTNGTAVGNVYAQDSNLQIREGNGIGYPFAVGTLFTPRVWNGTIHYHPGENLLAITTSGNGVGDLSISLTMLSMGATEGYLLVSSTATAPVGQGPFLGIYPDGVTFALIQEPLNPGDPLHFATGFPGLFPASPFVLGPGSLLLGGQVWDAVAAVFGPGFTYLGKSNVQRIVW